MKPKSDVAHGTHVASRAREQEIKERERAEKGEEECLKKVVRERRGKNKR